jgi:hypothetical protein
MSDLTKLSQKALRDLIAKRSKAVSLVCDKMIAAGYGYLTQRETEEAAKGSTLTTKTRLCQEYLAVREPERLAYAEQCRRYNFHGTDKPTKSVSAY